MGIILVPETPEIFQGGIALAVEKGVLQTIGLVASETVRNTDGVARLHPLVLVDHRNEWILLPFPGHPVVPADVCPGDRSVARLKWGLQREGLADRVRGVAKARRNTL